MPLLLTLARGVLTGIGKRPSPGAALPAARLVRPATPVDLRRLTAYARVCGFPQTDPVPLTYPHILGFPLAARLMAARAFPLPLMGLVHTSIEITQHRPLHLDDAPELTVYAEELRPHRRGVEVVMVTEARLGGTLVWEDRSAYLARAAAGDRTASEDRAPGAAAQATADAPSPSASSTPSDAVAQAPVAQAARADRERFLPSRAIWQLPAGLGRRHAAVSGDYNPIHLHPWTAKPLGFPRAIAHGMWTFARCVAEAVGPTDEPLTVRAEFRAPVLLPATVTYAAGCDAHFELRGGPDGERLHLTGEITRG
jgi:acyl dehydratase